MMFKNILFVVVSTFILSACSDYQSKGQECERLSTFSHIIMDARQNGIEKAFVIDKIKERKQEPSKTELELLIVERAYEMPIMNTPDEKSDMSRDFAKVIETLCKQRNKVDPSTIA